MFYLILGIAQAAHSVEEYLSRLTDWFPLVTGYIHNLADFFPILRMSEQTFVALNVAIITFLLSISPFVFQNKQWALKVANVVAVIEILNGLIHISPAIYLGSYYPGCISAVGLLVFGILYLMSSRVAPGKS